MLFEREMPHGLCVGVALPEPSEEAADLALGRLHREERIYAEGLSLRRRITWAGGRVALRLALKSVGCEPAAIFATERGAPLLPAGTAGSVSHKGHVAVALVAADAAWSIGVDVERARAPRMDIARYVLREEERNELAALPPEQRWREALVRFSAKESLYKALDPFVRRYVSFQEVAVSPDPGGGARVGLALRPGEGPFHAETTWQTTADLILTTARVRKIKQF